MIIYIDYFKNDFYRLELIIWLIQFLFRHQLQETIQSKQMIIKVTFLVIFLLRSNLVNCNQDDLKNNQQNRDSIIQSLMIKGTLVISIILSWRFTINRTSRHYLYLATIWWGFRNLKYGNRRSFAHQKPSWNWLLLHL